MHSAVMTHTKDELMEEVEVIKDAVRHYNVKRDMYRRWTLQFEMMRSMSGGKGGTLGDPEMIPELELMECDVSVYCIIFYQSRLNMNLDKIPNIKMHNLIFFFKL